MFRDLVHASYKQQCLTNTFRLRNETTFSKPTSACEKPCSHDERVTLDVVFGNASRPRIASNEIVMAVAYKKREFDQAWQCIGTPKKLKEWKTSIAKGLNLAGCFQATRQVNRSGKLI
jgi:hypothetical protein